MNVESVPPALLILGGSYIGLEFAQMVRRFGSKVAVVEAAPQLVPREDDDVSDAICDIPEREGISIHLATKCTGLAQRGATIVAQLEAPTGAVEIEATICCSQSAVGPIPTILASIKLG